MAKDDYIVLKFKGEYDAFGNCICLDKVGPTLITAGLKRAEIPAQNYKVVEAWSKENDLGRKTLNVVMAHKGKADKGLDDMVWNLVGDSIKLEDGCIQDYQEYDRAKCSVEIRLKK
ncbi:MAG: hypothetical protein ABIB71_04075 [Candidatus Woesearchaeota archaeon]